MSDTDSSPAPTDQLPASESSAPPEPPPGSAANEGVDTAPPGDSSPPEASTLIEVPVQGAAIVTGEPIPPAEAQPIVASNHTDPADDELLDQAVPASAVAAAEIPEHPADTIQRLRTKLGAYGEECLRAVQQEIEYLMSLCGRSGE